MDIYKKYAGYRMLDSYTLGNVVQLATLGFCRRFLNRSNDPCGRQFDQMTQAARSGIKNLVEGSERFKTSSSTCIRLMDVGRASFCELRDDYTTWLMDNGKIPWSQKSPEAQEVFSVRLAAPEYADDINRATCERILVARRQFAQWIDSPDGATAANALLILISRTLHIMDKQMKKFADDFKEEGGFHERMTAVRVEAKREKNETVSEDAPQCPDCSQPMRLRKGKTGNFWGCSAYPTCKKTINIK